ncbi:MAG: Rrf2 family transcriptional regulator [Candidatus Methanoplasma sp.]|jgi:Rrf2 family protein|nr:Rrf2 family transcriptional regulator [Candidatus Methanoplasma sp.]
MFISTKGRYAVRLMLDLAMNGKRDNVKIKEVSKRQDISVKYLEQIISTLNKAGYVKSERGPQGGYRLARPPGEYTAGMIIRLMEGSTAPVSCLQADVNECKRAEQCISLILWKRLNEAVDEVLDGTTLADMVAWAPKPIVIETPMPEYCI